MLVDPPGVSPASFRIGGVIFPHCNPAHAVSTDFLFQNGYAKTDIDDGIKQIQRVYPPAARPLAVDLHDAYIIGLARVVRFQNDLCGFLVTARPDLLALNVDGQGVQAGFLPGNGNGQGSRNTGPGARIGKQILRPSRQGQERQTEHEAQGFHSVTSLANSFQSTVR